MTEQIMIEPILLIRTFILIIVITEEYNNIKIKYAQNFFKIFLLSC